MSAPTLLTCWEPSAWMRERLAAIIAQAAAARAAEPDGAEVVVVAALTRHAVPGTREDRSCDRCGKYVPPSSDGSLFQLFQHSPRPWLIVTGGLCKVCAERETGGAR